MRFATLCATVMYPLSAIPIKVAATVRGFLDHKVIAIFSIPRNWTNVVGRVDFSLRPELLPGIRNDGERYRRMGRGYFFQILSFSGWMRAAAHKKSIVSRSLLRLRPAPILLISWLLGFAYRWCLKSTALVWLPLAYLINNVYGKGYTLSWLVRDLLSTPAWRAFRIYSALVIIWNGVVPVAIFPIYSRVSTWVISNFHVPDSVAAYLFVGYAARADAWQATVTVSVSNNPSKPQKGSISFSDVSLWHIAGVLAAFCTWIAFFWAGNLRSELAEGSLVGPKAQGELRTLQVLLAIRAGLSSYTIVCGVVAFAKAADWHWVHNIRVHWLP